MNKVYDPVSIQDAIMNLPDPIIQRTIVAVFDAFLSCEQGDPESEAAMQRIWQHAEREKKMLCGGPEAILARKGLNTKIRELLDAYLPESEAERIYREISQAVADKIHNDGREDTDNEQIANRFRILTAADFLAPLPPIEYLVDRLLTPGSTSVWYGESGSKKTYAMLYMAFCIAAGMPWLDFATLQAPTLIVDEESGEMRLRQRVQNIMRAHHAGPETPIHGVSMSMLNLLKNPSDSTLLHALVEETQARFVIIDALADVMAGGDENSVQDIQPVMQSLRKIADDTQSAIGLIHHAGKNGGYRGSTAIKAAVDVAVLIESKPKEPLVKFSTEKIRDGEPLTWAGVCRWMPDDTFDMALEDVAPEPHSMSKSERYVYEFLSENGVQGMNAIKGCADRCSSEAARRAVYSLVDRGIVHRVNPGGRGVEAEYAITPEVEEAA